MNTQMRNMVVAGFVSSLLVVSVGDAQQHKPDTGPATPPELVASYKTLAVAILAVKNTEENLVRSILASAYGHANAAKGRAQRAIKSGNKEAARTAIEELATYVAQLGTEGDSAVAGIRKRLVEGGHHHNAEGEVKGIYDPGYVVVTKAAKKELLDASKAIAQTAAAPDEAGLKQEWKKVQKVMAELSAEKKKK